MIAASIFIPGISMITAIPSEKGRHISTQKIKRKPAHAHDSSKVPKFCTGYFILFNDTLAEPKVGQACSCEHIVKQTNRLLPVIYHYNLQAKVVNGRELPVTDAAHLVIPKRCSESISLALEPASQIQVLMTFKGLPKLAIKKGVK